MTPPGEARNATLSSSWDAGAFEELRKSVASIASDLKEVAEVRAHAAREEKAGEGVEALQEAIRREPALAMGIALLAGAAFALIAVPKFERRAQSRWMDGMQPVLPVSRADLADFAESIQRNAMRAANSVPFASSLERLADAVTKIEPSSSLNSAIERVGALLQKIRNGSKN